MPLNQACGAVSLPGYPILLFSGYILTESTLS